MDEPNFTHLEPQVIIAIDENDGEFLGFLWSVSAVNFITFQTSFEMGKDLGFILGV